MNVLIVEDEMIVARHLATILKQVGYRVCGIATRVADALRTLDEDGPDVVLIDIMLDGERDGIDLAHEVRAGYHLPFLFITSHADPATVQRAKETHPNGYLVKPFTPEEVYASTEIALLNYADTKSESRERTSTPEGGLPTFQLKKVTGHIQAHLENDLTLAELADVAGLSKYYFSRLFKEATGMPPYEYVLEQRVVEARRRLRATDHSVARIALQTGFSSPSHLGKAFRERTGLSPSAFRKSRNLSDEQVE